MRAFLVAACAALMLAGCGASPYTKAGITGGFEERVISADIREISYYGNAYTNEETVQSYWLHRAADVAIAAGYDGFEIVDRVRLIRFEGAPASPRVTPVVESGLAGKPYLVARIRLLRAPLAEAPGAVFDARALKAFLDPYVLGEKCGSNVCPHVHRYLYPGFGKAGGA